MAFDQQTFTVPVVEDALPNTDDVPNQVNTLSAAKFFNTLYQTLLFYFSFLNKKIDEARPWKQFISYEKSPSFSYSNYKENVLLNLKTYYSNYIIIISACVILLLFCFKMFIFRDLLCMAAICLVLKLFSILRGGDSYTIAGHSFTIPVNYQLIAVVLLLFPYSGVVGLLYPALYVLISSAILTALYAALHDPKLSIPPKFDELYTVGPCNV